MKCFLALGFTFTFLVASTSAQATNKTTDKSVKAFFSMGRRNVALINWFKKSLEMDNMWKASYPLIPLPCRRGGQKFLQLAIERAKLNAEFLFWHEKAGFPVRDSVSVLGYSDQEMLGYFLSLPQYTLRAYNDKNNFVSKFINPSKSHLTKKNLKNAIDHLSEVVTVNDLMMMFEESFINDHGIELKALLIADSKALNRGKPSDVAKDQGRTFVRSAFNFFVDGEAFMHPINVAVSKKEIEGALAEIPAGMNVPAAETLEAAVSKYPELLKALNRDARLDSSPSPFSKSFWYLNMMIMPFVVAEIALEPEEGGSQED